MNLRALAICSLILLTDASRGQAQEVDSTGYFPLSVNNVWTYFTTLEPPGAPPDTIWNYNSSVTETIVIRDTVYHVVDYPASLSDTLRSESGNRIWARSGARDVLLFDLSLPDSSEYTFTRFDQADLPLNVLVRRDLIVEVPAGRFENCISLSFRSAALDDGAYFVFAPGVGIIRAVNGHGWREDLFRATINGQTVTTTDEPTQMMGRADQAALVSAYPNPASGALTIRASGAADVGRSTVFDITGRAIAIVEGWNCVRTSCSVFYDASHLAPGTYFVRIEQPDAARVAKFVLVR